MEIQQLVPYSCAGKGLSPRTHTPNTFWIIKATVTPKFGESKGLISHLGAQDAQVPPPSGKEAGKGSPHTRSWQLHVPRLPAAQQGPDAGNRRRPGCASKDACQQTLNLQPGPP